MAWRIRLVALAGAAGALAVALGIRALTGVAMVDSRGALAQYSGTALYAAMIYAGVFSVRPGSRPWVAGAAAIGFCWVVEFFQLTGLPAAWSEHSLIARLVLGRQFDPVDLAWYVIGVLPIVAVHTALSRHRLAP